ncbi:hypothetical protein COT42_02230 [Candidatus Saganbacteria bacterium CG08_land_8_20_14_0_20_45_16]|uniref:DUF502 domain-containing protein n=1 Tax=Candidatus Saganbacteria bacterium CG08_land_8_20_14_0_20_45_16 TaxID=2014293 RepID=A0A2H0Y0C1_UNCSA|nr:MAG: hypothetical protein COT42_02230 [Candidatus Saganbacteria bacterium CG08_land_8_20_14_0_20_45_16]
MWQKLSSYFLRGLITLLPLLVTIWLLFFLFTFLDSILGNVITLMIGHAIPGLGFIITILLIFIVGYFATYIIGAQLFNIGEEILCRVPIVKSIYSAAKQINDVLFMQKHANEYRRACLFEYPRKGLWTVGFVTSDATVEIEAKIKEKMINVFVANTPTPATGFLVLVPAREVVLLDMKIEDAFKYVVSGGVLKPSTLPPEVPLKKDS